MIPGSARNWIAVNAVQQSNLNKRNERKKRHMKTITNIIHIAFASFALASFGLSPRAQAVVPPPDGGYPNFTTAEGTNALQSLTTGSANTAVGWFSLFSNAEGSFNTATGVGSLLLIPQTKIRPLARRRFYPTRPVPRTQPSVPPPLLAIQRASAILQSALTHWPATPRASKTMPLVGKRFRVTQLAAEMSPLVMRLS